MSTITYIYALVDPRNDEVRYIGKTNNPRLRYNGHLSEARTYDNHNIVKDRWIRKLLSLDLKPEMKILIALDSAKGESWEEHEIFLIKEARKNGCRLTNVTDGGNVHEINPVYSQGRKRKAPPIQKTRIPIELIGTLPDKVLAKQLGMTHQAVTFRRKSLGIKACPLYKFHNWSLEEILLLGKMPDQNIARKLYVEIAVVKSKRIELGIEPFKPVKPKEKPFKKEKKPRVELKHILLLGKLEDRVLAEMAEVSISCIRQRRCKAGIPSIRPVRSDKGKRRTPEKPKSEPKKRGPIPRIPLESLGVLTDEEIAKMTGLSKGTIENARRKLKIPVAPKPLFKEWDDESINLIGTMPDINLARKLNIAPSLVKEKRKSLNIPHYKTNTICKN